MSRYPSLSSHPRGHRSSQVPKLWVKMVVQNSLPIYHIKLVWLNSITLPMRYTPTSQLSPVPIPAKSAFSHPRNCEPTREKLATKKDKNSPSSPPPKVIFPSSLPPFFPPTPVTTRRRIRKEQGQPRKEGRSEWSQERKDDYTNHIL